MGHSMQTTTKGDEMNKHLAPVLAAVAALGVVGGVAATQAFKPIEDKPATQVQFVQPAAETVTVEPTPTATTVAPKPVVKAKPKPVATVESAPKQTTQRRQAIVSEPAPEPTPASTPKFGTNPVNGAPNPPPIDRPVQPTPPPSS